MPDAVIYDNALVAAVGKKRVRLAHTRTRGGNRDQVSSDDFEQEGCLSHVWAHNILLTSEWYQNAWPK